MTDEDDFESVLLALVAFEVHRTPARMTAALRERGRAGLRADLERLDPAARDEIEQKGAQVSSRSIRATMLGDADYPERLIFGRQVPAPVLLYLGNAELFARPGIGMCGSRNASDTGMTAARTCGFEVSRRGLVVVSGYAKGVDTQTHLAALTTGGSTVIVLAEGFDSFRVKRDFADVYDAEHTLVVSQFPPSQPWGAYAAMARNAVIYGLGRALVVIEAGDRGGTLAAGEGALKIGRPVFVLDFGASTPEGNKKLLEAGSVPINSPSRLGEVLDEMRRTQSAPAGGNHLF